MTSIEQCQTCLGTGMTPVSDDAEPITDDIPKYCPNCGRKLLVLRGECCSCDWKIDSNEPITAEWWQSHVTPLSEVHVGGNLLMQYFRGNVELFCAGMNLQTTVKTRGELRMLCRLLGIKTEPAD